MKSGFENTTAPTPSPATTFMSVATGTYLDWHEFSYDVTKAYPTSDLPKHLIGKRYVKLPSWWWFRNDDEEVEQVGNRKLYLKCYKSWYGGGTRLAVGSHDLLSLQVTVSVWSQPGPE